MTSPSPTFYRVQDSSSFTLYSEDTGLNSNGKYFMRTDHIINAQRISTHLTWGARPSEPSPFISVFDNLGENTPYPFVRRRSTDKPTMKTKLSNALASTSAKTAETYPSWWSNPTQMGGRVPLSTSNFRWLVVTILWIASWRSSCHIGQQNRR